MFHRTILFVFLFLFPALLFSYTVVRKDGKTFSGELIEQNPQTTILKGKDGVSIRFRAEQIDWDLTTAAIRELEKQAQRAPKRTTDKPPAEISNQRTQKWTGERFTFDFKDIDIKDFFRFISDISGLNVILDPGVRGSITMKLTDVPWDQALDLVSRNEGLAYTIEGNVIRIAPYSKIASEMRARGEAEKEKMLSGELVTITKRLSYAKASDMQAIIQKMLTPRGSVIVDQRTNTLIITDVSTNIENLSATVALN